MPNDGWRYQGRQYHQWFGHGTKAKDDTKDDPRPDLGQLDDRIRWIAMTAIAAVPASKRHHAALRFDAKATGELVATMRASVGGLSITKERYSRAVFGRPPGDKVVEHMRDAARLVATARTHADMRAATDALGAGMQAVGLDSWRRFLTGASKMAEDSGLGTMAGAAFQSLQNVVAVQQLPAVANADAKSAAPAGPAQPAATQNPAVPEATPERIARVERLIQPGVGATQADIDVARAHVLENVPDAVLELLERNGIKIVVTRGSVAGELRRSPDEKPRGRGDTMGDVPAIYDPQRSLVIIATQDDGKGGRRMPDGREHGSVDAVIHEAGHGIDFKNNFWSKESSRDIFVEAYKADGHSGVFIDPYYHQDKDGTAGRQEAWAEAFAMYNTNPGRMAQEYPNLYSYFRNFMAKEKR